MPADLDQFYFSPSALGAYKDCPLRFRFRYLDGLRWSRDWSASGEDRAVMERGRLFHLLAQRYYEGLDPQVPAGHPWAPELTRWLAELQAFCPRREGVTYYPELELRLAQDGMRLLGKYDLVAVEPDGRATIYDWKTERKMPALTYLRASMQTMVYRFLLCAAGGAYSPGGTFRPEQVRMVYWNPAFPRAPQSLAYDAAQHAMAQVQLRNLTASLRARPAAAFHATTELRHCRGCEFRPLCHRQRPEPVLDEDLAAELEEELAWELTPDIPY